VQHEHPEHQIEVLTDIPNDFVYPDGTFAKFTLEFICVERLESFRSGTTSIDIPSGMDLSWLSTTIRGCCYQLTGDR